MWISDSASTGAIAMKIHSSSGISTNNCMVHKTKPTLDHMIHMILDTTSPESTSHSVPIPNTFAYNIYIFV
jgi:hypothetical protein